MLPLAPPQKTISIPAPKFEFGTRVKWFPLRNNKETFCVGVVEEGIYSHLQDRSGYWEYWVRVTGASRLVHFSQHEAVSEDVLAPW